MSGRYVPHESPKAVRRAVPYGNQRLLGKLEDASERMGKIIDGSYMSEDDDPYQMFWFWEAATTHYEC